MKKIYDLAVKVGSYTTSSGEEKGKYINVGAVLQKDDGGKFIVINRTFSPAGVPNPENKDTVIVSMFTPKQRDAAPQAPAPAAAPDENPFDDSAIPF